MPPRFKLPNAGALHNALELIHAHLLQPIIVHNSPAPRPLTPYHETTRGLFDALPEDTPPETNPRAGVPAFPPNVLALGGEGSLDLGCGGGGAARERADEVGGYVGSARWGGDDEELGEDVQGVGAVAAAAGCEGCGAELGVLFWVVGDAVGEMLVAVVGDGGG